MTLKKPYFIEIICCLADQEVEFIICGGVAAIYHGVERVTMDLDISINLEKPNVEKFLSSMRTLNLTPRAPVPPESLLDQKIIDTFVKQKNAFVFTFWDVNCPYRQVDVFLTHDTSYQSLINKTVQAEVEGRIVRIISIEKLTEMKLAIKPLREKDKFDIQSLKKIKDMSHET